MHGVTHNCIRRIAEKDEGYVATVWATWKMRNLENTMRTFDACFVESVGEEEEKVGADVKDQAFLSSHLIRMIEEYRAVGQEYEKAVGRRLDVEKGVHALLPRR
jgi:hypothetical protein